ncbi:MAG: prepilin-type N-terminal cleavage/methylation domain-containing protein, partial [Phormidium sp.]
MQFSSHKSNLGYTLLELLVIVIVIGMLAAIMTPSWFSLLNRLRLNAAQAETLSVMRQAQANARREKRIWQANFRDMNGRVQWSLNAEGQSEANQTWNNLIGEDANKISILNSTLKNQSGVYSVQFKPNYWVNGQLGRITFVSRGTTNTDSAAKRCVFVSTLIGAMRT